MTESPPPPWLAEAITQYDAAWSGLIRAAEAAWVNSPKPGAAGAAALLVDLTLGVTLTTASSGGFDNRTAFVASSSAIGGYIGGVLGGLAGSIAPGLGNAVGAGLGATLGSYLGTKMGESLWDNGLAEWAGEALVEAWEALGGLLADALADLDQFANDLESWAQNLQDDLVNLFSPSGPFSGLFGPTGPLGGFFGPDGPFGDLFGPNSPLGGLLGPLGSPFGKALPDFNAPLRDPLIIDLDGDGLQLVSAESSSALFDIDGDGFAESVGWFDPNDGLLVRDLNSNGIVDNAGELFGNDTLDAFAELAGHDGNQDGVINQNDAIFSALRVWRDADSDGATDAGEVLTLAGSGRRSCYLSIHKKKFQRQADVTCG